MPNSKQKAAIVKVYRGHAVHKTTLAALYRKGFVERGHVGNHVLTEAGLQYLDDYEVPA